VLRADALIKAATVDPGVLGTAVRAAVSVTACVAVGQALDEPTLGLFAALGAFNVAIADTGGPYSERMAAMVVGLTGIVAALAAGAAVSRSPWVAVGVLAVVAFLAGLVRSYGPVGAKVGLVTTVAFLLSSGIPGSWTAVWQRPLAAVVGGLATLLLVAWSWPLRPDVPARRRLVETFAAIADLAEACAAGDESAIQRARVATRTAREGLRRELDSLGAWRPGEDPSVVRLAMLGLEAGRLESSLGVLSRAVTAEDEPPTAETAEAARAVAEVGRMLAAAVVAGGGPVELDRLDRAQAALSSAPARGLGSSSTLAHAALELAGDHCRAAAGLARQSETPRVLRPFLWRSPATAFGGVAATVRRELTPGSTGFRYAAQLAVATAAAGALARSYGLDRAYWAPLTVTLVLQPNYGLTARRTVERIAGTLIGAFGSAALLGAVSGDVAIDLLIFAAALATLLLFQHQAFRWTALAITPLVLLLIETVDPSRWELAKYRVLDTLVGAAAAFAVAGLMRWRPDPLATGRELALPVAAARAYLAACLDDDPGALDRRLAAHRRVDDALARTEELAQVLDATGATRARNLVPATRRFADAVQGLELLSSARGTSLPTAVQAIGEQVGSALDELAASLEQSREPGWLPDFEGALHTVRVHAGGRPEDALEVGQAGRLIESAQAMASAAAA
jgi:uncharacterized membrane protein YccC